MLYVDTVLYRLVRSRGLEDLHCAYVDLAYSGFDKQLIEFP